jgi:hypothetical protein
MEVVMQEREFVLAGRFIPSSYETASEAAIACEDAVVDAPSMEERERLTLLANAYWELSDLFRPEVG